VRKSGSAREYDFVHPPLRYRGGANQVAKVIDFSAALAAKAAEDVALRSHVDTLLELLAMLSDTLQEMREIGSDEEVAKALRIAIDVLERPAN
jgi:hypothetical protein